MSLVVHTPVLIRTGNAVPASNLHPNTVGCSCGWRPMPSNADADDQFASHVAMMRSPPTWIVCPLCGFTRGYDQYELLCRNCRAYVDRNFKARQTVGIAYDAFIEGRLLDAVAILDEVASKVVDTKAVVLEWARWDHEGHPPKHR